MTRPKVIDTFPFHSELDLLECRLTELFDAVDHFVLVESPQNHQGNPKHLFYAEHADRFAPWADKIVHVITPDLPSAVEFTDPWVREHAQREYIGEGLTRIGVVGDDILLQSDIDEIPRALHARNVRPTGMLAFEMRLHCFAVDWLHPQVWRGTVAGRASVIHALGAECFGKMRDSRNTVACPPYMQDAGWHLSWLGGVEAARKKLEYFCHTEITDMVNVGLADDFFYAEGWHVDGTKMKPVDVDESWPRWIVEGNAPQSWFRPR